MGTKQLYSCFSPSTFLVRAIRDELHSPFSVHLSLLILPGASFSQARPLRRVHFPFNPKVESPATHFRNVFYGTKVNTTAVRIYTQSFLYKSTFHHINFWVIIFEHL